MPTASSAPSAIGGDDAGSVGGHSGRQPRLSRRQHLDLRARRLRALRAALEALFGRIDAGELTAITSELTLAELLVKPLQMGQDQSQRAYLETLQSGPTLTMAPVSRAVLLDAARLRGQQPALKLPDAIHAATALACNASVFVTNDARFAAVAGLTAIVLHAE